MTRRIDGHSSLVTDFSFSPHDDGLLATGSQDQTVKVNTCPPFCSCHRSYSHSSSNFVTFSHVLGTVLVLMFLLVILLILLILPLPAVLLLLLPPSLGVADP